MDIVVGFFGFFALLIICIIKNIPIYLVLLFGLLDFSLICYRRGFSWPDLFQMMKKGSKKSLGIIQMFILIGFITALWRMCGTIPYILYHSIYIIPSNYFIISTFLLSCGISFLLGSSFGTVGTIGVILIALSKGTNTDLNIVAGAIISGAYFGDRCSPISSSANLVCVITDTGIYKNVKNMFKTSYIPFIITAMLYIFVGFKYPVSIPTTNMIDKIAEIFNLQIIVIIPAVIVLVLPLFRVDVKKTMFFSIISSIIIGILIQHVSLTDMLYYMIRGYKLTGEDNLDEIISGGGLVSMINVGLIVFISSAYSEIFEETRVLKNIEKVLEKISNKVGCYMTLLITSILTIGFSCNQALGAMLTHQFCHKIYEKNNIDKYTLACDMENTVIIIAATIPWSIAITGPAAILSVGVLCLKYSFYLYFVPIINIFIRKISNKKYLSNYNQYKHRV